MAAGPQKLRLFAHRYALCKLPAAAPTPAWASAGSFSSVTRVPEGLSVICEDALVPGDVEAERGWRMVGIEGPIAYTAFGILAALTVPLADARVSICVVSSAETDYILFAEAQLDAAVAALRGAGHDVRADG